MTTFTNLIKQDLKLSFSGGNKGFYPIALFTLSLMLFTFSLGPDPAHLSRIAAALLWALALLTSCQQEASLIEQDAADGSLDQHLINQTSLPFYITSKTLTHWTMTGLPILCLSPLYAEILNLDFGLLPLLMLTLLLGTPTLSLLTVMSTCLTLGAHNGFVLRTLTLLPLTIPILIFASGTLHAATLDQSPLTHLKLLGASLLIAIVFCPVVSVMTLRDHTN